jgi:hypothetical protein
MIARIFSNWLHGTSGSQETNSKGYHAIVDRLRSGESDRQGSYRACTEAKVAYLSSNEVLRYNMGILGLCDQCRVGQNPAFPLYTGVAIKKGSVLKPAIDEKYYCFHSYILRIYSAS